MPLHRIFHTPGTFSEKDKQELAKLITDYYVCNGLPPFYVVITYIPLEPNDFYVGGKPNVGGKFVRIAVDHLARALPFNPQVVRFFEGYEAILAPFIKDRGLDWEIAVSALDANLWRENGLIPPLPNTEAEKEWVSLNKPVPFTEDQNVPPNLFSNLDNGIKFAQK